MYNYKYATAWGTTRKVSVTKALRGHESAKCGVDILPNGSIQLISYSTTVIFADKLTDGKEYYLSCTGTYSATTRKHIRWFLNEYFPNFTYYDMKRIAETGEVLTAW